jgi:mediator of RNA polymerase II transcription subunit 12
MGVANMAQLGFVASLLGDYMSDMARHVTIGRHCLRVLCDKVLEVSLPDYKSCSLKFR